MAKVLQQCVPTAGHPISPT